jgi:photosystem II stability/assembly factor-like uncharacterized protein
MLLLATPHISAQPRQWTQRGTGGGGSLYAPSINPANNDEFYVGCDMSELFHTMDFGSSYAMLNFQQMQGGQNSKVQFTVDPATRYCINYANDLALPVKSIDSGKTWEPLSGNPLPYETAYGLSVDYNNPGRVILAYYGSIHFSSDGGSTFTQSHTARNSGAGVTLGGTFFDGSMICVGTNDGLLVSTNGGGSFGIVPVGGLGAGERIFSFAGSKQGSVVRFYCLTADSNDIYVGVPGSDYWGFMKGVYSLDYGSGNWIQKMAGITPGTDFPMYVATAQYNSSTVFLAGSNSSGTPNVMKSTDGGNSWTHVFLAVNNQNIGTGWSGQGGDRGWGYGECVFGLAVAPNDPMRVLITDFGFVHKTSDGGATWQQAYLLDADQNPAGQNTPVGKTYHSTGLENTSCWQLVWSDAKNLFACCTDIKGIRSTDGGQGWSFNYLGHSANTMYRIVRNPVSGTLYAATSGIHDIYQSTRLQDAQLDANDPVGKIITSTDKGATWTDLHVFGHPVFWLALDPGNPNRIYSSVVHSTAGGIFVTSDLQNGPASSWNKLPDPPRTEGHPASIVVLNDGSVVCTYSGRRTTSGFTPSSGVFVYSPGTNSWTDVSDPGMRYWTKDVVIDPYDPSQTRWYVGVFSGWGGPPNGLGGLYRTTDRGTSWAKISNLDRVTSCTISPSNPSEMYLTTETSGLWHTTSLNTTSPSFTLVGNYPFRQPERVFYNPYIQGEVWVTSFGAGMMVGQTPSTGIAGSLLETPQAFRLEQNYPNPFNPSTNINYTVAGVMDVGSEVSHVRLVVDDLIGREVAVLVDERKPAGTYTVRFDASDLASGVYFYRLTAGEFTIAKKLMVIR